MKKLLLLLLALSLFSCRSRKLEQHKKVEKVNEIVQNDITMDNDIHTSTEIQKVRNDISFSVEPLDPGKPSRVSYNGDTLDLHNAKLVFGKSEETENTEQHLQDHSKYQDNTSQKTDSTKKEKDLDSETHSASWGLNLGFILIVIVLAIMVYIQYKF